MSLSTSVKIRAKEKGGEVTVKILMTHPMETGLRKDKKTGEPIPADYVENIVCEVNGKPYLNTNFSGSVSQNPFLSFKYAGNKGDEIKLTYKDNSGNSASETEKAR